MPDRFAPVVAGSSVSRFDDGRICVLQGPTWASVSAPNVAEEEVGIPVGFVAMLEGRPAATGMSIPSQRGVFLIAGAVAPWARGRGLYRALVRARWDDAVARGTPALVTQANPETSYPILRRLGFEEVCEITRLEDVR
ncbi:MAG: GNAT family N-acetyltransferase [Actinomycetota bacterium]|nr:GNAT family N-acetyltransferase [Actinomycetota bacterium]